MPREDKGTSSASPLKDASGGENTSSLAARRARLRGTLARATTAEENFEQIATPRFDQDGFMSVGSSDAAGTALEASVAAPTADVQEGGFGESAPSGASQPLTPDNEDALADENAHPQPAAIQNSTFIQDPSPASMPSMSASPDPASESSASPEETSEETTSEPSSPAAPEPASSSTASQPTASPFSQDSSPWGEDPTSASDLRTPSPLAAFIPAPVTPPPFVRPPLHMLPSDPPETLELLHSIDQSMNACATNLARLQSLSSEQTDVLRAVASALQNQTLSQLGFNLNSLTDSLSAALEPMKAIGELVPAMDQLVTTLEGREAYPVAEKMSPDHLVTSLADQLSAGLIDPWTFKCAYMAVFPDDHPADLLHRLVELLGTQRLSGDLFRAAYEAVQAAEPPAGGGTFSSHLASLDPSLVDETIRKQLDQLQKSNEEIKKRQEEREAELTRVLETKDKELAELHEKMQGKYEEVSESIGKREDEYRSLLESKDMELVEKESENNMLRAQMEELRSQTEDMVKDMQKQIADLKVAHEESVANQPPKPVSSFFDNAPSPARSLFDSGPQKTPFDQQQAAISAPQPQPAPMAQPLQPISQGGTTQPMQAMAPPAQAAHQMSSMPAPNGGGAPPSASPVVPPAAPAPPPSPPAPPQRPQQSAATTPFNPGQGSYGSGVRAQVFEVIVRQALAGAPWREICAGPMQVNNITPDEVEAEVKRRQALLNK
jgi:hypothetical protein